MGDEAPHQPRPKPSKWLMWIGVGITVVYLVCVGWLTATRFEALLALAPNEWGDFLAGAFGPLAFLWLVLGYFLQRDELRYSAEALWLQSEELKNSVEQQRALVEATRDQVDFEKSILAEQRIEFERQAQPIIRLSYNGRTSIVNGIFAHHILVENLGETCTDFAISVRNDRFGFVNILPRGESTNFNLESSEKEKFEDIIFTVTYIDRLGSNRLVIFETEDGNQFVRRPVLI